MDFAEETAHNSRSLHFCALCCWYVNITDLHDSDRVSEKLARPDDNPAVLRHACWDFHHADRDWAQLREIIHFEEWIFLEDLESGLFLPKVVPGTEAIGGL